MEKEDGVWRTIRGRRIFIRSGESLGSAMSRSGKFKRENLMRGKRDLRLEDRMSKYQKARNEYAKAEIGDKGKKHNYNKAYNKLRSREHEDLEYDYNYDNPTSTNQRITNTDGKTRVERYKENYSEADKRELRHEELQKKLADYKANTLQDAEESLKSWRIYRDRYQKSLDRAKNPESKKRFLSEIQDANKEIQKAKETIEKFKAKKQSNNKITQGEPLKELANERIKEKENTLANDKAMLEGMKRKGIKEVNGWTEKDFENRIKKNEDYLKQSNNKIDDVYDKERPYLSKEAVEANKKWLEKNPQKDNFDEKEYDKKFRGLQDYGKQSNNKIEKSKNNYDSKTLEQAKAELGWGHHNLTNEKAVEEKFGKQSNNKVDSQDMPYERDLQDVVKSLNDEGSDFSWNINEYKDGKANLNVGVFMPDERGYVDRDVEFDLKGIKGNTAEGYSQIEDKIREWQDKHSSPDTFYDDDFEDKAKKQETIKNYTEKKQSNNSVKDDEIVNDDKQAISYSFRTNKRDMFTIRYDRVGNNKNMDFATTASTFNRNRTDYDRAGQAQKDVLKEGTKARAFYDKWDKKHLGTLTQKEYKELVNDIEDLKKEYPYIQGDRFYDQVELDRSTKDKKSKIEAYKKRKGK